MHGGTLMGPPRSPLAPTASAFRIRACAVLAGCFRVLGEPERSAQVEKCVSGLGRNPHSSHLFRQSTALDAHLPCSAVSEKARRANTERRSPSWA